MVNKKQLYRVIFQNKDKVYEVYAHQIYQSDLHGFVEVEGYAFGEKSQFLVDPAEEKLKTEFSGVNRSYIPMHSIVRIDEVESEGVAKMTEFKGNTNNVAAFPNLYNTQESCE